MADPVSSPGLEGLRDLVSKARTRRSARTHPAAREPGGLCLQASRSEQHVERFTFLSEGKGWLFAGRTQSLWPEALAASELTLSDEAGHVGGAATTAFFPMQDRAGWGFAMLVTTTRPPRGRPLGLSITASGLSIEVPSTAYEAPGLELANTVRRAAGVTIGHRHLLLTQLPRPRFVGLDTTGLLSAPIRLGIDRVIRVPPDGLALAGWLLDPTQAVLRLTVRGPARAVQLDPQRWIQVHRPDIAQSLGLDWNGTDEFGFLAYAPGVAQSWEPSCLEVETREGEIGFKPLQSIEFGGMGVIKQVLSIPRQPVDRVQAAFDTVLGPLLEALNRVERGSACRVAELLYGPQPTRPDISVVLTLHSRVDLLEYQLALFSEAFPADIELIYVLDDPSTREQTERLAASCWSRFRLPFRLLLPDRNLGVARARNLGARRARGTFLCFLDSDVFPAPGTGLDWLPRLAERLGADPVLGAVGPVLLYDDGTLQHGGMTYTSVSGLPFGWAFPACPDQGQPAPQGTGLRDAGALTGSCIALRREEFLALRGFDEGFLFGDFEDSDLCLRLRGAGLRCAVDTDVQLYHLERQSQPDHCAWRGNATLFNAWRHHRLWAGSSLFGKTRGLS